MTGVQTCALPILARLAVGDTQGAASDAQIALTHFDKEAAAGTPAPESLARRAVALHVAGDTKGAVAAYDTAIKAAPKDPTLLYRRGVLRMTSSTRTSVMPCSKSRSISRARVRCDVMPIPGCFTAHRILQEAATLRPAPRCLRDVP